jgi:hypothetical protein
MLRVKCILLMCHEGLRNRCYVLRAFYSCVMWVLETERTIADVLRAQILVLRRLFNSNIMVICAVMFDFYLKLFLLLNNIFLVSFYLFSLNIS